MPRPGPRPYECVRRAWHSDRHHPVRGSLIQEIFRIVNEVHSSATRKNREWQEKLPIVVLRAEEIMYSEANSEAEYSDLKTLWDRVNDAINTIVRIDESTETGEFLQPCIEAALQLGCTPRRSSRSQRCEPPGHYLRSEMPEAVSVPSGETVVYGSDTTNRRPITLNFLQYLTNNAMNSLHSCLHADNPSFQNGNCDAVKKPSMIPANFAQNDNHHPSAQAHPSSNTWSVYPLYYSHQNQPGDLKFYSPPSESDKRRFQQNVQPCKLDSSDFMSPSNLEDTSAKHHEFECDLTLRLGSPVVPSAILNGSLPLKVENGKSSTPEGANSRTLSAKEGRSLFPSGQL